MKPGIRISRQGFWNQIHLNALVFENCDPGLVTSVPQSAVSPLSGNGTNVSLIELHDDPCEAVTHMPSR